MGNKRQRLAKKRFSETNPLITIDRKATTQTETENDSQNKPQKVTGLLPANTGISPKTEKEGSSKSLGHSLNGGIKKHHKLVPRSSSNKHPLRVPGCRPGEGCFLCKAKDHIAKLCPQKRAADVKKICLFCRHRGHTVKYCPQVANESGHEGINSQSMCYNCGEGGHRLADCPKPKTDGKVAFAVCFVCGEKGHLSRDCLSNENGVYPKGGSCKVCGKVTHLAKHCPNKTNQESKGRGKTLALQNRHVKFQSGDDLQDDFGEASLEETSLSKEVENKQGISKNSDQKSDFSAERNQGNTILIERKHTKHRVVSF